jgi:hypothetical protein
LGVTLAVADGLGAAVVGRADGTGVGPVPALQETLSIRQFPGSACAEPAPCTTKPTSTVRPDSIRLSQDSGFTTTCWPVAVKVAFQSESIFAPVGRSKDSVQSSMAPAAVLVTTYWPV